MPSPARASGPAARQAGIAAVASADQRVDAACG